MRRKFTILLFSLLLAVGWTNDATAQKVQQGKPWYQSGLFQKMMQPTMTGDSKATAVEFSAKTAIAEGTSGKMSKAPLRANYTQTAPATHIKSWYDGKHYTWYDGNDNAQTASYTDPVTDTCQMFWFIRNLYTDQTMPGIKYTYAQNFDLAYEGCDFGYWISGDITQDIYIAMTSYCYITYIAVYDYAGGDPITYYDVDDGNTPPTGWSMPNKSYMTRTQDSNGWYYWKFTSNDLTDDFYDAFTISKDLLNGHQGVYVYVNARNTSSTANRDYTYKVYRYDYNHQYYTIYSEAHLLNSSWGGQETMVNGPVTPPTENGYSVVLVKLQDDFGAQPEEFTYTDSALYSYYHKYVKEMQLLTDGLRVNENTDDAGTLFAYTGDLSKFYFISKGKLYPISGSENAWIDDDGDYERYADRAPFYNMYEEFSPFIESGTEDHSDFYEKMKQGKTYPVLHDCMSVAFMRHYFAMTGEEGSTENRVNSLVLYIPDNRGASSSRTYDTSHQPTVGMYMIDLYADIEPSTVTDYYTVTVNWYDNLDTITHSDGIPQTYYLYEIKYNEETGLNDTTLVYTGPLTTWTQDYPVGDPSAYDISYYVIGTPTAATNKDVFFAKSNTDDVTVPGKSDFIGLQWWRYESDYVTDDGTNQEVNYYRNFLAPHALAVQGQAGINAGNVGTTGRTLTLYRSYETATGTVEIPVFDLDLMMNGNKAYYRIRHRDRNANQQVEPGYDPNTGEKLSTNN